MADLPESNEWTTGIYQLETSDPVLGGPEGIDNLQAKQLANRTRWLKDRIDTLGVSLAGKAGKATTLGGYGITDAFTKPEATSAIQQAIASLVASSPASLDTLKKLADALGNDPNFATSMTNALAGKAGKATTLGGYGITDAFTKPETTSAIQQAIASLVASSPASLDTLKKLADALGNDPNFATSMTSALAGKANKATTLSGYGITDAYPKTGTYSRAEVDAALAAQVANAVPKGYCVGFVMSMNAGAPAMAVDVLPGTACGAGNPVFSAATITGALQAAGSWTAGTGGNKLDAGTRAANSWYHVFLIRRNEGGEADLLFSMSSSAPAVPAGYELVMRLKGRALRTDGAANIAPFINYGNSTDWKILPFDMTLAAVPTSSHTVTISVPPGVRVRACFYVSAIGEGPLIYVRSPDAAAAVLGVTSGGAYAGGVGLDSTSYLNENFASYCEASTNQSAQVVVQVFAWPNYLVQSARLLTAGWRED
ncbi:hypothetical protein GGD92_06125 [Pseudomonas protegens]|uniref:Phage tail protein n=1 Tax=Pseudomonas protegens TaxID=380021 RepID=A0A7G7XCZ7_9PSED|nr:hypothetical protein [Pseudomonas protegens]QNH77842.1 hypothetical protein GGI48_01200 [Pseudomonas protegens]QNL07038.1 hypothetical protein GGD92_06125 [Pseudomonas protegens]